MTDESHSLEKQTVQQLADRAYAAIAWTFPICAASDEFYFFPQVLSQSRNWCQWDDFSPRRCEDFASQLRGWEDQLVPLASGAADDPEAVDAELLRVSLRTLREQLIDIAPQHSQPSFHLGVVAAGLSEALESDDPQAWPQRIEGLPAFLQRGADLFEQIPQPFQQIGSSMLGNIQDWLRQLEAAGHPLGEALNALQRFAARVAEAPLIEDFRLLEDQFSRLLSEHLCCGLDPDQARRLLEDEYAEMDARLQELAAGLDVERRWQELEASIPFVTAPDADLLSLYRPELGALADHVQRTGFCPPEFGRLPPPQLCEVPENLMAVRASDAYNALPGHPARGGTFFVLPAAEENRGRIGRSLEYRLTAIHETWPGHHLLDSCRWNLSRPLRRPLERPLCYEGWACLAEELMFRTGYLDDTWDRFLLARRRIERAARGLIDLELQCGRMSLKQASRRLVAVGYSPARAAAVVPKYALRPGYQTCYTLGLRRMLELLDSYAPGNPAGFARSVLRQGQIGFTALEAIIRKQGVD